MQLKTIFNRVTEYKPFVVEHVELVEHDSQPTIEITMRAHENGQPHCSKCGDRCPGYDTPPTARRFQFIPLWMIPVVLVYSMRRVQCPRCGVKVESVPWADGKGHKYQTVVYQIDEGRKRLLWVGPDRTAKTLLPFFRFLGKDRSRKLQFVCSDMWQAYLKVIAKKAPQAIHIPDRFHVMQKMSKAIDRVRAAEAKQLKDDGYEPVLTGSRWLLLKRPENLSNNQAAKLKDLLQYNLKSVRSHLMKEDFQRFRTYTYPAWAGRFLDAWCTRAMRSRIEPMQSMARTLRSKRELLLNWFRADGALSSGVVEGFNNKLKLITRKSYGFRTQNAYETALYHNLADLPFPKLTHCFF